MSNSDSESNLCWSCFGRTGQCNPHHDVKTSCAEAGFYATAEECLDNCSRSDTPHSCYRCNDNTEQCEIVHGIRTTCSEAGYYDTMDECSNNCYPNYKKCWSMKDQDTCTCSYEDAYYPDNKTRADVCDPNFGNYSSKRACENPCKSNRNHNDNNKHNNKLLIIGGIVGGIILLIIIIGIVIFSLYEHHKNKKHKFSTPNLTV